MLKKFFYMFLGSMLVCILLQANVFATPLVNGLGGSAGFGENHLRRYDDGSSRAIDISSVFPNGLNFYGTNYTHLYVNNNGNITFYSSLSTYTPFGITQATFPIIAPFFADVDTRGGSVTPSPGGNSAGTNLVYWDLDTTNHIFTATWDDVGYYSSHTDKVNAFQVQLIQNGPNPGDFDIKFIWEDINWTTGDLSGGSGGLGGTVARAGWSAGDSVHYYEIPQSGNQNDMLGLDSNPGEMVWQVRNGNVIPQTVPEPTTMLLLGSGMIGLFRIRRRKQ